MSKKSRSTSNVVTLAKPAAAAAKAKNALNESFSISASDNLQAVPAVPSEREAADKPASAAGKSPAKKAVKTQAKAAKPVETAVQAETPSRTKAAAAAEKGATSKAPSKAGKKEESKAPAKGGKANSAKAAKPAPAVVSAPPAESIPAASSPRRAGAVRPTARHKAVAGTEAPVTAAAPKAGSKLEKNLAARPARSLQSPIRIFQIYFEGWQKELLDPAFAPLNNAGATSEALEFDVFERLSRSDYVKGATLWGALSWRFAEKTGMSGSDLIKVVEANPGMDVYFCNPHPQNEALFHNMWTQGETTHPRFLALTRAIFQAIGLTEEEADTIQSANAFAAANYFIATPAFWAKYLPWVRKVLAIADKKLSPEARALLHSAMADERGLHRGSTYVPFIVERLFAVFLKTEGKGLKAYKFSLPERERELNVHLKLLREMKDVAHRTKSPWLAACWVNYRNLYLSQINGKAWCQKYLRAITPTDIKFG